MFDMGQNVHWTNGMPNATEFIQSRMNPVLRQANVNPFREAQVGPGLGPDAAQSGDGGFNSGMMARELWSDKSVDSLRIASKPKATEMGLLGYEGAPVFTFRSFVSTDLSYPARGPVTYDLQTLSQSTGVFTANVGVPRLNERQTGILMTPEEIPLLRGILAG